MSALPAWMMWVAYSYGLMSVVTFVAYGLDKRRARLGRPRFRERSLHGLELLGGYREGRRPGARHAARDGADLAGRRQHVTQIRRHGSGTDNYQKVNRAARR